MEELEQFDNQIGHLRPIQLQSERLPATSMKLEQMRARDESIAKLDRQTMKLSHLRLKTDQNDKIGAVIRN